MLLDFAIPVISVYSTTSHLPLYLPYPKKKEHICTTSLFCHCGIIICIQERWNFVCNSAILKSSNEFRPGRRLFSFLLVSTYPVICAFESGTGNPSIRIRFCMRFPGRDAVAVVGINWGDGEWAGGRRVERKGNGMYYYIYVSWI